MVRYHAEWSDHARPEQHGLVNHRSAAEQRDAPDGAVPTTLAPQVISALQL